MKKLLKGDEVKIVAGKDKGKTGKIEKVFTKESRVLISGVNQYKRHLKARSQTQPSEIITVTKPLPLANIQLVCPKCHLLTRIGFMLENKKKLRICRKCQQTI
ncbi:MAG: 50S ribosomal protein L24 [Candidatus Levybacteria bacterium]|nr:50S ribosomal protein L24 [Candidatus Levybacteria bacterium]MBI2189987.1 50S ribosomal protein L24 [Candidatus Levybacteria bacterium]MBI2622595.1 50S ribosomal protein L24 [Candidatus Levybacteria bacterium]MBI3070265.1 50S ribosomal protein L24 [Candidatus Levybacteria bacterium]MBI3092990.1 50S ribosomal protein L24 [Candidatus Levybacteria bacterium]